MDNQTPDNLKFNLTFRNDTASTEAVKSYAEDKLRKNLSKFVHEDTDVHVVFDVEKDRQIAELALHCYKTDFICKEESESMYKTIDLINDKIMKQLRRHKDKIKAHH